MKNKGFSFVELIVAVAILGIISLPIASSFVLAARIEAKAAILSKINDAADDVMLLVEEAEHMDGYGNALEQDPVSPTCSCMFFDVHHALQHESLATLLSSMEYTPARPEDAACYYAFTYNGYDMELKITPCDTAFYRIDLTIEHEANGSTYHVTRKGVLSYAA